MQEALEVLWQVLAPIFLTAGAGYLLARKLGGVGAVAGVDGGEAHSLAVLTDGTVLAWGLNDLGQLGDGSGRTRTLSVALAGIDDVAAVAAGAAPTAATNFS